MLNELDTGDLKEALTVLQETRTQVKEQLDKEARRNNVIIYRAPESTKATFEERTKDDRDYVLELMNDILEVDCRNSHGGHQANVPYGIT